MARRLLREGGLDLRFDPSGEADDAGSGPLMPGSGTPTSSPSPSDPTASGEAAPSAPGEPLAPGPFAPTAPTPTLTITWAGVTQAVAGTSPPDNAMAAGVDNIITAVNFHVDIYD